MILIYEILDNIKPIGETTMPKDPTPQTKEEKDAYEKATEKTFEQIKKDAPKGKK